VVIDRARFPRDKLCGGGISGRAQAHLAQHFNPLPETLFRKLRRVRLSHQGQEIGQFEKAPAFWMTMRADFDASLMDQARSAGAQVIEGARIKLIDPTGPSITLEDGRSFSARLLIGADGVNSATGRALFGRAHDPRRIGFALEVEAPARQGKPVVEIDLGAAQWGYGWAFPKPYGLTIGVGGVQHRNPDLRSALVAYAQGLGVDLAALRVKGHHLPFGDARPDPGRGAVLLAGDAAGLVDPITGEGIAWAIHSGALAASACAQALADAEPAHALPAYRAALAPVHQELRRARFLRGLVYAPFLARRVIPRLARHPGVQRRYLDLLAGRLDYADITAGDLWRALRKLLA
jgi:geranylgeranyl reductase family protein